MDLIPLLLSDVDHDEAFYAALEQAGPDEVAAALTLATHPDAEVRVGLTHNLPFLGRTDDGPTAERLRTAIVLTRDPDARVRDAATFVLGEQWREVDTPELRAALADRVDDLDVDTRCEAVVGLAYRRDPRALPLVRAALSRTDEPLYRLELIAAGALADSSLYELLLDQQDGWDDDDTTLIAEAALHLCDPDGPGADVLAGTAELYRCRARGLPTDDALRGYRAMSLMLDLAPHRAPEFLDAVVALLDGDEAAVHAVRTGSALAQIAADVQSAAGRD